MLLLTRLKNLLIEHRCTGHCCKAFILPDGPPMNLQRKKEIILEHNKNTDYEQDILKVIDMVTYLGSDPTKLTPEQQKIIPLQNYDVPFDSINGHNYYTCRNHNSITGDCLIHDTKPSMCKQFPRLQEVNPNGSCSFRGCTRRYSIFVRMVNFYKTHSKPLHDKWRYGYYYKIRNAFFFLTHGRKMTFADMVDITDLTKAEPKELMCLNESRPQLQNPQKNIAKRKHVHVAGILSPLKNLRKRIIDD